MFVEPPLFLAPAKFGQVVQAIIHFAELNHADIDVDLLWSKPGL